MANSFRYEFTGRELIYLLFQKKVCPCCGGPMKKKKDFEIIDGARYKGTHAPIIIKGPELKLYSYVFICQHCHKVFPLAALATKKGDNEL